MKNAKFIITVPFYNVEKYIERCIKTIQEQTYQNYKVVMTNDNSSDKSYDIALELIENDKRFSIISNKTRKDVMENTVNAIKIANPHDEDIIVTIDGDDWLHSKFVFEKVNRVYETKKVVLTYGNYQVYPSGQKGHCSQYSEYVIENNLYRKDSWRASQLRTFKYKLWKNIKEEDLKHPDGSWMFPCADQTYMLPMLEMSGGNFHFFDEILYVYNRETPLNTNKYKMDKTLQNEKITRSRKPYNKIKF